METTGLLGRCSKIWTESQTELHDLVTQHLRSQGFPADGPNLRERVFDSTWSRDEWTGLVDAVVDANPSLDVDDVGMMMCYVSGIAPKHEEERIEVTSLILS